MILILSPKNLLTATFPPILCCFVNGVSNASTGCPDKESFQKLLVCINSSYLPHTFLAHACVTKIDI